MTHTPQSLRELAAEIARESWEYPDAADALRDFADALRDFATHLETECKDAARFREIAAAVMHKGSKIARRFDDIDIDKIKTEDEFRAAIDAAMQAEGETK